MLRGFRTLPVRMARHGTSALEVARFLDGHPKVARVLHPALASSPGHAIFKRDFSGASGLFGFVLHGSRSQEAEGCFCDTMRHFRIGFSWGGFESLIIPARAVRRLAAPGPAPLRFRVSIGLEDPTDLIADLADALDRV
jgi:cystathionine beta-lyase